MNEPTTETLARRFGQALVIACSLVLLRTTPILAVDGSTWQAWPKEMKGVYVMGVVDTWHNIQLVEEAFAERVQLYELSVVGELYIDLTKCMTKRGMRYVQIVAIVQKRMDENPAGWDASMASNVWTAINEVCGTGGEGEKQ